MRVGVRGGVVPRGGARVVPAARIRVRRPVVRVVVARLAGADDRVTSRTARWCGRRTDRRPRRAPAAPGARPWCSGAGPRAPAGRRPARRRLAVGVLPLLHPRDPVPAPAAPPALPPVRAAHPPRRLPHRAGLGKAGDGRGPGVRVVRAPRHAPVRPDAPDRGRPPPAPRPPSRPPPAPDAAAPTAPPSGPPPGRRRPRPPRPPRSRSGATRCAPTPPDAASPGGPAHPAHAPCDS
jgi:hypothetical protein